MQAQPTENVLVPAVPTWGQLLANHPVRVRVLGQPWLLLSSVRGCAASADQCWLACAQDGEVDDNATQVYSEADDHINDATHDHVIFQYVTMEECEGAQRPPITLSLNPCLARTLSRARGTPCLTTPASTHALPHVP